MCETGIIPRSDGMAVNEINERLRLCGYRRIELEKKEKKKSASREATQTSPGT